MSSGSFVVARRFGVEPQTASAAADAR